MKLREPEKQILDDFEHKVTGKIAKYGDEPDFPKLENYGITRMELDDYLFDKQAILDMGGSKRSQLTMGGFITVLPVLVLSCFPDKSPIYRERQDARHGHRRHHRSAAGVLCQGIAPDDDRSTV